VLSRAFKGKVRIFINNCACADYGMISNIDQFRYIKIQPKTIDLSTRLWGINPTNSVVILQSLALRSIVLGSILIYIEIGLLSVECHAFTSHLFASIHPVRFPAANFLLEGYFCKW